MTRLEYGRVFPVDVQTAYDVVVPASLTNILGRRYLAIPGVRTVEQDRPWGQEVGQRRVLRFSDGGSATEVLTTLEAPARYGYRLTDVRGPMKALAVTVEGLWTFAPDTGTDGQPGTQISWSWDLAPTRPGRLVMPGFARVWRGMAARTFDRIGELF